MADTSRAPTTTPPANMRFTTGFATRSDGTSKAVARALFELDRQVTRPPDRRCAAAANDATALEPYPAQLPRRSPDRLCQAPPKDATPEAVHHLTMQVRAEHASTLESQHIEELAEGLGTGWAVNGVRETLQALSQGQVRFLLVRGEAVVPGFRSMKTGRLSTLARDLREDGEVVAYRRCHRRCDRGSTAPARRLDVMYDPRPPTRSMDSPALLRFK